MLEKNGQKEKKPLLVLWKILVCSKYFLGKRRKTFHHFRHTPTCTKLTFISLFSFFKRFLKLTHLCDANHDESKSKSNLKCSNVLVNIFFNLSAGQFRGKTFITMQKSTLVRKWTLTCNYSELSPISQFLLSSAIIWSSTLFTGFGF